MLQMFVGIGMFIVTCMFAFGLGMAEEMINPTIDPRQRLNSSHRHLFFWCMIVGMIATGFLLGYK